MSQYRCTQCQTVFDSREYDELERVPMDPEDQSRGYERECSNCGSGFHSDKWQLQETVEVDEGEFVVSTVGLTIPHGLNHDQWYETLVRAPKAGDQVERRYETQEEAEAGHADIIEAIENEQFHYEPTAWRFVLEDHS